MKELNAFKKFLNEGKLFEALNKDLKEFGPDLEKKLKDLGLAPSILSNDKKNMAFDAIGEDPKKVAIVLSSFTNPLKSFELVWNSASEKIVMKAVDNFQTQTGQMSSKVFQKSGWDEDPKYTKNLNPGDIFKTKVEVYPGDLKAISYYRVPPNRSESLAEGKLDDIRRQIYKGMDLIDGALGKAKGSIPQEDWDSLYALVSKIESKAEYIKDVKEKVNESFDNDMESRYNYIRPLMVDLDDSARTEAMIDGMEDAMMEDDKEAFDFYFVETMKMLGLEQELMDDVMSEGNDDVLDEILKDDKFEVGDKVTMKAGGEEMEITKARRLFGSDTQGYTVKKADGKTAEYSANQLKKA